MSKGLVSIIMPAYNSAEYLNDAIRSIIGQSYKCWELIIINDCSTDITEDIIYSYIECGINIKYHINQENLGAGGSRNIGLDLATGDYIAFLDSDDLWIPNKLELQLSYMIDFNLMFTFTDYARLSCVTGKYLKGFKLPNIIDYNNIFMNTSIAGCSTVMIKNLFKDNVKFKSILSEDLLYWIDYMRFSKFAHKIPEVLSIYRIRPNSSSYNKYKTAISVWKILRYHTNTSFFYSCYLFSCYLINSLNRRFL
jgi:glycosyltransferase involved in cell wall biosynthesis